MCFTICFLWFITFNFCTEEIAKLSRSEDAYSSSPYSSGGIGFYSKWAVIRIFLRPGAHFIRYSHSRYESFFCFSDHFFMQQILKFYRTQEKINVLVKYPSNNYLFKVSNGNTTKIKVVLVFLLLTMNIFHIFL